MKYILANDDYVIEYCVTENELFDMPSYGIEVKSNYCKAKKLDNIFFTYEEALLRCKWLFQKEVMPEIFKDIMADIMV